MASFRSNCPDETGDYVTPHLIGIGGYDIVRAKSDEEGGRFVRSYDNHSVPLAGNSLAVLIEPLGRGQRHYANFAPKLTHGAGAGMEERTFQLSTPQSLVQAA